MREQLPNILVWAIIWILSWAIFFFIVKKKKFDYVKNFVWTALYFLLVTFFTFLTFRQHLIPIFKDFIITPFVVLGSFIIFHFILYFYFPKYIKEPKEYFKKYPERQYLTLSRKRLVSKSMELLAQQLFVVLLVLFLQNGGLNLTQIIILFAIIFGVVHAPLIIVEKGAWPSWYFTVFSILSAIIFPILIIKINYGFVYTYIVHWAFYTLTAVGFWTLQARKVKAKLWLKL